MQFDLTADGTVFAFATGAAVLVGLLVGVRRRGSRRGSISISRSRATLGFVVGRRRLQGREMLVVVQVALCVVLLHASFLAVRGLQRASTASLGWNPTAVMAATELGLAR